jgi:hypothetical protein
MGNGNGERIRSGNMEITLMEQNTKPPKTGPARLWEFVTMKKPLVFGSLITGGNYEQQT